MTKIVGTIGAVLKLTNIVVVLFYLSACLIPILPAGQFWMIAMLGLVFPLLFVVVTVFFAGWLIAGSKWCLLSLIALLLSWQQLAVIAGLNTKKTFSVEKPKQILRVLTWNISSWSETSKNYKPNAGNLTKMIMAIKDQAPDIICLQEFWDKRGDFSNTKVFSAIGYPYSYFIHSTLGDMVYESGVAILSKYPITDTARFTYGANTDFAEPLIYADIQFNEQKVRVFTTHLESVRFENDQYVALRKIKQRDEEGLKNSKTIVRKLKNGYMYRGFQADLVRQKIKESPYPVIVCGDFNDVPNSYTYFTIKGDLKDVFLNKGTGLGRTFQYLSPTLRIDYILVDKNFEVKQFDRMSATYSDHFPIVADLSLPSKKKQ
ncbi:MAG: endonuclease/exonuclease/phosphatase family protein [Ferruginibacter sp.]